ncbi:MAG: heparin lyase I family protein [Candidatus Thiodiazotropha sp. DIVDIV]
MAKKIKQLLIIILFSNINNLAGQELQYSNVEFDDEFNKNIDSNNWYLSGNIKPQIVKLNDLNSYAVELCINKGKSYRNELSMRSAAFKAQYNIAYKYEFRTYLPSDYRNDQNQEIIIQWHAKPDKDINEDYRSPPLSISTINNNYYLEKRWDNKKVTFDRNHKKRYSGYERVKLDKIIPGKWENWEVYINWSYSIASGFTIIKKNGKYLYNNYGPNTYNDTDAPYQKLGLYKWLWKEGNMNYKYNNISRRCIRIDSISITSAGY